MNRKLHRVASAALLAAVAFSPSMPARAEAGAKAGILTCNVNRGWGFIFGSTRELMCSFSPTQGPLEHYTGHIHKFGVDIGYQSGGIIVWAVLAPTIEVGRGALAGEYAGVSASVAAGIGAGANILLGGFKNSITLQPISIEGTTGLNVAAGISQMTLDYKH